MRQKLLLLFILIFLLVSACSSNDNRSLDSQEIESDFGTDGDEDGDDDNFLGNEDEGEEGDDDEEETDDKDGDDEDCRQDSFDRCIYGDGSGWINIEQNFGDYTPPRYEVLPAPKISNNVWYQVNGPFASVVTESRKTAGGFWVATDGDNLSYSQIYFVDEKNLRWNLKKDIRAPIKGLAVNPNNPDHVAFIVGQGWGEEPSIYLSVDRGSTWNNVTPQDVSSFNTIAFSKTNPVTLYAAAIIYPDPDEDDDGDEDDDRVPTFYLYTTENFGNSWSKSPALPRFEMKSTPLGGRERDIKIEFIEPSKTNNKILFLGVSYGLLYTEDGGYSWDLLDNGFNQQDITSIAISESNPNLIYLRVGNQTTKECEYVDELREEEWEDGEAQEKLIRDTILSECPNVIKSTDGGKSWKISGNENSTGDSAEGNIYINPYDENIVYNVWSRVVISSENKGDTWKQLFQTPDYPHIPDVGIHDLLVGNNVSELFIGGIGGFYQSTDSGKTWIPQNTGVSGTDVLDIEIAVDGSVFAATQNHGVWKSNDGGINWSYASFGIKSFYGMQLLTHPTNPDIAYYTTSAGIYKTTDGGKVWKTSETLCPEDEGGQSWGCHYHGLVIDPDNPDHLLIGGGGDEGTADGIGINKTLNGGLNWIESDEGFVKDIHVSKMAVDPSNYNIFYATSQGAVTNGIEKTSDGAGVFKSTDKGKTWKQINNGLETLETNVIVIDPNDGDILYLGTDDDGVYKSIDGGNSWKKLNLPNLPVSFGVGDIAIDPDNSNVVFVGTLDYFRLSVDPARGVVGEYGIFKTTDGGDTWVEFNNGLKYPGIFSLAIDKENRVLLAGTRRGGIYWLSLDY